MGSVDFGGPMRGLSVEVIKLLRRDRLEYTYDAYTRRKAIRYGRSEKVRD
jgi:hypothetical protein